MLKTISFGLFLLLPFFSQGQKKQKASTGSGDIITVPLKAENWTFKEGKVEFITHQSRPAMKINFSRENMGAVVLKNFTFTNGIIEYDQQLSESRSFAPIYFRWQDSLNNECFYLRNYRAGNTKANDAVQYAPIVKGAWLWNAYYDYQAPADFKLEQWNHIKLVVSGKQMLVYVNGDNKPTLQVLRLEADVTGGTIGFDGNVIISNLIVKPNAVEGLPSKEGMDITDNDARYIRNWQVSPPVTIPAGIDYSNDLYPDTATSWEPITAERRGLVNLSRKFGKSVSRRIVWLKTNIPSPVQQYKQLDLGFSDDIWVFINGKLSHVDKNTYMAPIRKEPDGRISVENTSFILPLQKGDNELLIGISNSAFAWGIVARLEMKESDVY